MISYQGRDYICALDLGFEQIRAKWKAVILCHLDEGPKRFLALQRMVTIVEMLPRIAAEMDAAPKEILMASLEKNRVALRPGTKVMEWAEQPEDGKTRQAHYPHLQKTQLIPLGYISERSGHSRGSTVDLSLYDLASGQPLDMGGDFDLMDEVSHHHAAADSQCGLRPAYSSGDPLRQKDRSEHHLDGMGRRPCLCHLLL